MVFMVGCGFSTFFCIKYCDGTGLSSEELAETPSLQKEYFLSNNRWEKVIRSSTSLSNPYLSQIHDNYIFSKCIFAITK